MGFRDIIKGMTFWDKVLILLLSGITVLSFYVVKTIFPQGAEASIDVEGRNIGSYSLEEDRILKIKGPLGITEIEIRDGKVRVIKDPSRYKICINQGWISKSGEALICLPSRIIVSITGEGRYDAISW